MNAIQNFVTAYAKLINDRKVAQGFTYFDHYDVEIRPGKKYSKILSHQKTVDGKSINQNLVAFIDNTTGDIFKPASWAAPAKHARGNVNSAQNGMEAITPDGFVFYLKN